MSMLIAIDGPSGSGKSTTAKLLARRLGLGYLDTGAMYRAATTEYLRRYPEGADGQAVAKLVEEADLVCDTSPDAPCFHINGHEVTEEIREPRISAAVSTVATNLEVRRLLTELMRRIITQHERRIVVEGRDITTVVAPDAEYRILLTASEEARLARRARELFDSDDAAAIAATHDHVVRRDRQDATVSAFFEPADGVVGIDTSSLTFSEAVAAVLDTVAPVEAP